MPEGHTIHRLARDHSKEFVGQKMIVDSPQGRFSEEADKLNGKKLTAVEAYGKHLFYRFGTRRSEQLVHIHLGLYGKFRLHKNPAPEPRGAVRVRMIGKNKAFDLNGPTCCEILPKAGEEKLIARLGQDPLRNDADPELVWERFSKSRSALGTLLLNQAIIAGVGNVYRADILFLLGLHPERAGNSITREEFDELWDLTVRLLRIGVKYNRIITADRSIVDKPPSRMNSRERLVCYKKTRCITCGSRIKKWTLGSRNMYACEKCQK
ncbi:MAG: Fpg/Nei family DNA glycosylase [Mariniblastus sp.]